MQEGEPGLLERASTGSAPTLAGLAGRTCTGWVEIDAVDHPGDGLPLTDGSGGRETPRLPAPFRLHARAIAVNDLPPGERPWICRRGGELR